MIKKIFALAPIAALVAGCMSTDIQSRSDDRENALQTAIQNVSGQNSSPQAFVNLVEQFEQRKNERKDPGDFIDYQYVKQVSINQLTGQLKRAIADNKKQKADDLVRALLKIDPANDSIRLLQASDFLVDTPVHEQFYAEFTPTSSIGTYFNQLAFDSIRSVAGEGKKYSMIYDQLINRRIDFDIRGLTLAEAINKLRMVEDLPIKVDENALRIASSRPMRTSPSQSEISSSGAQAEDYFADEDKQPSISANTPKAHRFVFKNAPISEIMSALAQIYRVNFIVFPDVIYGYAGENIPEDFSNESYASIFRAEFIPLESLVGGFKAVLTDSKVMLTDDNTKTVWIKGNRGAFIRCLEVTRTIDVPEAEIEVKVEMYEVSSSVLHNIGLRLPQVVKLGIGQSTSGGSIMWSDWISNATSKSVRAIIADGSFRADMQSQNQYIGTLSSPTLRVQDGQRARIFVGDKTPVFQTTVGTGGFASESVSYVDTGIKLELDAKIVPNNSILLSLTLDATELGAPVTTVSGSSANRITSRNTVTRLTIEDGQTILLGGYLSKSKSLSRDGMPFLGQTDLAFIGGNRTSANIDRELVMFVTPKIVRSKVFPSKRIMTTLGMDAQRSSPVVIKPGSVSGGVSSGGGNSGGPSPFTAPPALGSGGGGRSN